MERKKKLYYLSIIIFLISAFYAIYLHLDNPYRLFLVFVSFGLLFCMPTAFKLFHLEFTIEIKILNVLFIYLASLVGSCLGGYGIPLYDKFIHFLSGICASTLALIIYSQIKQTKKVNNKQDYHILLIFINTVNLSIAALWEFYEYTLLILFNNDCINHYTTGVHDSITDMMCAFIAGLLITFSVIQYYKKGKKSFFISLHEGFYESTLKRKTDK